MSSTCIIPFYVQHEITGEYMACPCGKCPPCLKRRVSGWSFRLKKEADVSTSALFVTLTYDTDHVPITEGAYMTLSKEDVQKFFKRLRKLSPDRVIKYYATGEYGTNKMRPHYHIILFNADKEHIVRAWALDNKFIGEVHIGEVNDASIGYTLKYMHKPKKIPQHKNDDRVKEFSLMSKGLGKSYLKENMIEWHRKDMENRMYLPLEDGKKIALPRYYKDKIFTPEEKQKIGKKLAKQKEKEEEKVREKLGDKYLSTKFEEHKQMFRRMHQTTTKRKDL